VFDSESGLYYYNARYFDPELGRFIQPDTEIPDIGNPQCYNRYSYCLNDPVTYNDPSGHIAFLIPIYLAGAALTTYAVDHLYWSTRIAANESETAAAMDRIASSTGKYASYAEFIEDHQTSARIAQAGSPEQRQAALGWGNAAGDAVLTAGTTIVPALKGARVVDEGVNLTLKYKQGWTDAQKAAADAKAAALSDADTVVTKTTERGGTTQARYRKDAGLDSKTDADHTVDLQLGGKDTPSNMSGLGKSVNRSLGAQIQNQIKNLPDGTTVNNVKMTGP